MSAIDLIVLGLVKKQPQGAYEPGHPVQPQGDRHHRPH